MKIYVVDASVIVSVLLQESMGATVFLRKISTQLQNKQAKIYSLFLLDLEVANALRFRLKDQDEAVRLYEAYSGLPIEKLHLEGLQIKAALKLAYDKEVAVYDCAYHVLAIGLDGVFVTSDKEYFKKAGKMGNIEFV